MSDHVWLAEALMDVRSWRALTSDLAERDRAHAITCGERNDRGESLGPECFPTEIWPTPDAKKSDLSASADLFYAGTHWIVSGRFADLLRQFDMGGAHLYPVTFHHADRQTTVKGTWFAINFGNQKAALLPEQSEGVRKPSPRSAFWSIRRASDDSIAFAANANAGGAIWIDPTLENTICLSGPLGDAMRAAGVIKGFTGLKQDLLRGRIVSS